MTDYPTCPKLHLKARGKRLPYGRRDRIRPVAAAAGAAGPGQLEAKGVQVHIATPEENEALEAIMRPAFNKAFGENDPDSQTLIELIGKI